MVLWGPLVRESESLSRRGVGENSTTCSMGLEGVAPSIREIHWNCFTMVPYVDMGGRGDAPCGVTGARFVAEPVAPRRCGADRVDVVVRGGSSVDQTKRKLLTLISCLVETTSWARNLSKDNEESNDLWLLLKIFCKRYRGIFWPPQSSVLTQERRPLLTHSLNRTSSGDCLGTLLPATEE